MDMIYTIIYNIYRLSNFDFDNCTNLNDEEEDYKQFIDKLNEFKDHPNLLSWQISDEMHHCFNKLLRHRTLAIHQLDPNHPSFTALFLPGEVNLLMNTTDIMGLDNYPIEEGRKIREVNYNMDEAYKEILKAKLFISVIQIFDWAFLYRNYKEQPDYKSNRPTLQEMRSMSWQAIVAGVKGLMYYSLWEFVEKINEFKDHPALLS